MLFFTDQKKKSEKKKLRASSPVSVIRDVPYHIPRCICKALRLHAVATPQPSSNALHRMQTTPDATTTVHCIQKRDIRVATPFFFAMLVSTDPAKNHPKRNPPSSSGLRDTTVHRTVVTSTSWRAFHKLVTALAPNAAAGGAHARSVALYEALSANALHYLSSSSSSSSSSEECEQFFGTFQNSLSPTCPFTRRFAQLLQIHLCRAIDAHTFSAYFASISLVRAQRISSEEPTSLLAASALLLSMAYTHAMKGERASTSSVKETLGTLLRDLANALCNAALSALASDASTGGGSVCATTRAKRCASSNVHSPLIPYIALCAILHAHPIALRAALASTSAPPSATRLQSLVTRSLRSSDPTIRLLAARILAGEPLCAPLRSQGHAFSNAFCTTLQNLRYALSAIRLCAGVHAEETSQRRKARLAELLASDVVAQLKECTATQLMCTASAYVDVLEQLVNVFLVRSRNGADCTARIPVSTALTMLCQSVLTATVQVDAHEILQFRHVFPHVSPEELQDSLPLLRTRALKALVAFVNTLPNTALLPSLRNVARALARAVEHAIASKHTEFRIDVYKAVRHVLVAKGTHVINQLAEVLAQALREQVSAALTVHAVKANAINTRKRKDDVLRTDVPRSARKRRRTSLQSRAQTEPVIGNIQSEMDVNGANEKQKNAHACIPGMQQALAQQESLKEIIAACEQLFRVRAIPTYATVRALRQIECALAAAIVLPNVRPQCIAAIATAVQSGGSAAHDAAASPLTTELLRALPLFQRTQLNANCQIDIAKTRAVIDALLHTRSPPMRGHIAPEKQTVQHITHHQLSVPVSMPQLAAIPHTTASLSVHQKETHVQDVEMNTPKSINADNNPSQKVPAVSQPVPTPASASTEKTALQVQSNLACMHVAPTPTSTPTLQRSAPLARGRTVPPAISVQSLASIPGISIAPRSLSSTVTKTVRFATDLEISSVERAGEVAVEKDVVQKADVPDENIGMQFERPPTAASKPTLSKTSGVSSSDNVTPATATASSDAPTLPAPSDANSVDTKIVEEPQEELMDEDEVLQSIRFEASDEEN